MTTATLQGMRVAILVSDGFLETELLEPKRALEYAGAATFVVSSSQDRVKGRTQQNGEKQVAVDIPLHSAKPEDFHALLLPGVAVNNDSRLTLTEAVGFAKHFLQTGKPVAAIGNGARTLLLSGGLRGCAMTSDPALNSDLVNAGARWVDQEVVSDGTLVTSRKAEDMPAFDREMVRVFAEYRQHATHMRKVY